MFLEVREAKRSKGLKVHQVDFELGNSLECRSVVASVANVNLMVQLKE